MRKVTNSEARPRKGWRLISIAAALLGAAILYQPDLAHAAHGGGGGGFHGGGFHGGGFHAGGFHSGGFHGGGFHAGGFHGGGFHAGGFHGEPFHRGVAGGRYTYGYGHGGHWYHGWHGGNYGWWLVGPGLAWTYYDYPWWGSYPDYDNYGYTQPYASQTWYYCADPAGYYPYVTLCYTGWQTVPAS